MEALPGYLRPGAEGLRCLLCSEGLGAVSVAEHRRSPAHKTSVFAARKRLREINALLGNSTISATVPTAPIESTAEVQVAPASEPPPLDAHTVATLCRVSAKLAAIKAARGRLSD